MRFLLATLILSSKKILLGVKIPFHHFYQLAKYSDIWTPVSLQ
jgi:hypothetical protein